MSNATKAAIEAGTRAPAILTELGVVNAGVGLAEKLHRKLDEVQANLVAYHKEWTSDLPN